MVEPFLVRVLWLPDQVVQNQAALVYQALVLA